MPAAKPIAQKAVRKSLAAEVYRVLRKMIIQRQLEPGAKIVEGKIAALLGVSRTPVREAFQQLQHEGWLESRHGYSARVARMKRRRIREIYPLLAVVEGLAVRSAAPRIRKQDLDLLEECTRKMETCHGQRNVEELLSWDARFHGVFHRRSQNERARRFVNELRAQIERLEFVYFSDPEVAAQSLENHNGLVRALREGSTEEAAKNLERQWTEAQDILERIISRLGLMETEGDNGYN